MLIKSTFFKTIIIITHKYLTQKMRKKLFSAYEINDINILKYIYKLLF